MAEKVLLTDTFEQTSVIFGNFDANVQLIENSFGVRITNRNTEKTAGTAVVVSGEQENVENAYTALAYLKKLSVLNDSVTEQNVDYVISMVKDGREDELEELGK